MPIEVPLHPAKHLLPLFCNPLIVKKILIIGPPGAGKSIFAKKLAAKSGLPLYHLDRIWHRPDRTTIGPEAFDREIDAIMSGDAWILDGDYPRTLERRLQQCDTVFFFDFPPEICLSGARNRLGKQREDFPWYDNVPDEKLERRIFNYPTERRPVVNRLLSQISGTVICFSSREQAEEYIIKDI